MYLNNQSYLMRRYSKHSSHCSCKNCLYKGGPITFIAETRLDNLYREKHIPQRERILLQKLIRTRAVYDDIRKQILLDDSGNLQNKYKYDKQGHYAEEEAKNTDDVIKIVNLVDRGQIETWPSNVLGECCDCCLCGPKFRKPSKGSVQIDRHIELPGTKNYQNEKSINEKINSRLKTVRFKSVSYIRLVPCTCALQIRKLLAREPVKSILKKFRSKERIYIDNVIDDYIKSVTIDPKAIESKKCFCALKFAKYPKKSIKTLKQARSKLKDGISASATKVQNSFKIRKDSITKFREKLKKKVNIKVWECEPDYCLPNECLPDNCYEKIQTRKIDNYGRSTILFFTDPKHKSSPNLKEKRTNSTTQTAHKSKSVPVICECNPLTESRSSMIIVPILKTMNSNESTTILSNKLKHRVHEIKLKNKTIPRETIEISHEPFLPNKQAVRISSSFKFEIEFYKKKHPQLDNNKVFKNVKEKRRFSDMKTKPLDNQFSHNGIKQKEYSLPRKCKPLMCIPPECDPQTCADMNILTKDQSSFCVNNECDARECEQRIKSLYRRRESKLLHKIKSTQTGHPLKQCFCTFKLQEKSKPEKNNSNSVQSFAQTKVLSQSNIVARVVPHISRTSDLLRYDREPFLCIPGECNSLVCKKRIQSRYRRNSRSSKRVNTTTKLPRKSKPSITLLSQSRSLSRQMQAYRKPELESMKGQDKSISYTTLKLPQRQAVRIGSNFSFHIEFSKDRIEPDKNANIKYGSNYFQSKATTNKISRNTLNNEHFLKRCFCTLQLINARHRLNKKVYTRISGLDTSNFPTKSRYNNNGRSIAINTDEIRQNKLPPCDYIHNVPDEFDPHKCAINMYNNSIPTDNAIDIQRRSTQSKLRQLIENAQFKDGINRCFCTLKLHKNLKQTHGKSTLTPIHPQIYTMESRRPLHGLVWVTPPSTYKPNISSNECEPYFCIPEDSNLKACNKRIVSCTKKSKFKQIIKYTQVEQRLRRCVCSLIFNKNQNVKPIATRSKKTMTSQPLKHEICDCGMKRINFTQTKNTFCPVYLPPTLLPYECEPFFCSPGDCHPITCEKRIKTRYSSKIRQCSKDTNTRRVPRKTAFSFTSLSTSSSRKTQAHKPNKDSRTKISRRVNKELSNNLHNQPPKQAVRIGSNFSFDIEFYKDKILTGPSTNFSNEATWNCPKECIKYEHKKNRGQDTKYPSLEHKTFQTNKNNRSKSTSSKPLLKRCFCNLQILKS